MSQNALKYTVQPGDTYYVISQKLGQCQGITYQQIQAANPPISPESLSPDNPINIPDPQSPNNILFKYTVQQGDTYFNIATALNQCAGVSYQSIEESNPNISPDNLQVGDVINIPSKNQQTQQLLPAPNMGFWNWTWQPCSAPANATISIAFSGYADPNSALENSTQVIEHLTGKKFISLGGGETSTGYFTQSTLNSINSAINSNKFKEYDGIAYDVECGDSRLASAFQQSFAVAKEKGFIVLVTISHSAPYGISDASDLMKSFLSDPNIDFLSPQLYTQGNETQNDYSISQGVQWSQYAQAKAVIIPSLVSCSMYTDAQKYFTDQHINIQGYIQWKNF